MKETGYSECVNTKLFLYGYSIPAFEQFDYLVSMDTDVVITQNFDKMASVFGKMERDARPIAMVREGAGYGW